MIIKKQNALYDLRDVFWAVLPRDVLEIQSKVYGGAFFAKIANFGH